MDKKAMETLEKQGTVTIPVQEYNNLRDFREGIKEKKIARIRYIYDSKFDVSFEYYFLDESDIVRELQEGNNELLKQNDELRDLIESNGLKLVAPKTSREVYKMTPREFKKWKKDKPNSWKLIPIWSK